MFNGRSFKTSFIIHQEYPELISPDFRCCFDYIIIGKIKNNINFKRIYRRMQTYLVYFYNNYKH